MSVLLPLVLVACAGAATNEREMAPTAPTPIESRSTGAPAAAPASTAAPANAPDPAPAAAASAEAPPEPWFELSDSPGAPELTEGAAAAGKEDWQKARLKLDKAVAAIRGKASLDATLAGEALLGRTCAKLKNVQCAEKAFSAVLAAWKDPAAARAALDAQGGDEQARKQRLRRALLAVAEARFFAAERRREELERMRMPELPGNKTSSREVALEHIQTRVVPWRDQKRALVEEVDKEYRAIADLAPSPPPRWAVDASARASMLWGRFLAEFRATPIPQAWKSAAAADLRSSYYEELDRASEPVRQRLRTALLQCEADTKRLRHEDEMSLACTRMLEKMFPER